MDHIQRIQNHRQVFKAFKNCLDNVADLRTLRRELDRKKELSNEGLFNQLTAVLGAGAEAKICDYFIYPAEHHIDWQSDKKDSQINDISTRLVGCYIAQNPSQYAADAIIQRLQTMLRNPFQPGETKPYSYGSVNIATIREWYFYPRANDCLSI